MNRVEEKLNSLFKYRSELDSSEQEVFDILIQYAREVMVTVNV
ncbi:Uncharacterised protein [Candidatus Bilamarchaeum dharawalense]|uniref:Uncharacterized protein n=1 Tax=Candidatus Bilamarchaeum dharawalense TaxID=2885759 RepID=A0A5E4LR85_9ARCH|nr:Uncharacterised protein [Candidatus Bilamarchaeum dharawalense]